MRPIEITIRYRPKFLKGIAAITLWPCVIYFGDNRSDSCLRAHELFHWKQIGRCGVIPWYIAYLILLPFYPRNSKQHPLEQMAYHVQSLCKADTWIDED